jgi:hypothetical protein
MLIDMGQYAAVTASDEFDDGAHSISRSIETRVPLVRRHQLAKHKCAIHPIILI